MKLIKTIVWSGSLALAIAVLSLLTAPKLRAAIRATFVEIVIPSQPFYSSISAPPNSGDHSVGPGTGTLAITNITVSNFNSTRTFVSIYAPIFAGGGCGSPIIGAVGPALTIWVQPLSTQTITYPSPLVFAGAGGHTCIAAGALTPSDNLEINFTGFVN
jgi:hypothetical protein